MKGIAQLINQAIKEGVFPGGNYCLIIKDKTTFGSFGARALYPDYEVNTLETIYDMASCSKVIATTSAIMKLLEQGKLRLFDAISSYLPFFNDHEITVWDLLTHSSGLPPFIAPKFYNNKDELIKLIQTTELKYAKNQKIVYSDLGFIILGWLVEEISKMRLDEFTKKYIFTPLGMLDTTYNPVDIKRCAPTEDRGNKIDRGYVHDEAALTLGGVAGHAGLFSTVKDISKFLQMILNNGIFQGQRILSPATIKLLFTPQVEEPKGVAKTLNRRGLGWIMKGDYPCSGDLVSQNTIMHTGFTGTHLFIDKDYQVAFCLLTNRVHPTRDNTKIIAFRAKLGNYIMSHIEEE